MNKTVLVIGIMFLLPGVSVVSSTDNISRESSICRSNNPPYEPSNPNPPDGTTNVSGCSVSWTGGDPDGDTVTYDVYFGNTTPPPKVLEDIPFTIYDHSWCELNTTYYWQIVATDEHGASTSGPIWSFITRGNSPPMTPIIIGFENETLYFYSIDPDGDDIRYIIDWGDGNIESTGWYPSGQIVEMSHSWIEGVYDIRLKAVDIYGAESDWSDPYTIKIGNDPPSKPIIDGPTHGKVGVEYTYTFNSTDSDGEHCICYVDWDDGSPIETVNPTWYNPGESGPGIANHSWDKKGTYIIRAKAIDEHGRESDWGNLTVTMPRDKVTNNVFLWRLAERFPLLQKLLLVIN